MTPMASSVGIDVTVFGEKQVSRELLRFSDRAIDGRPAFTLIGARMREDTEQQFDSEGRSGSAGWAPLKPETIAFKHRHGYPLEILHRTLALKKSLTQKGAKGSMNRVTKNTLTYGSKIFYGPFHQGGTKNMPRRRPVEFTGVQRRGYVRSLQRYIVTGQLGF